jgi:hypothetical protein
VIDYTKEAEDLLDELFGPSWRVNPKHEDGHAIALIAAALRRAVVRRLRKFYDWFLLDSERAGGDMIWADDMLAKIRVRADEIREDEE